jgi:twinkle protein
VAERGAQRPETLHDLLDLHRIQLGEMPRANFNHGGARSKLRCPACDGGRHKEKNFFVRIDADMKGATWQCFRASCGITGGGRIADAPLMAQRPPKQYRTPPPLPRPSRVPESLIAYYERFGISEATLEAFGIARVMHQMPVINRHGEEVEGQWEERACIAYPYVDAGELVNVKYKAVYDRGGKLLKRFVQEKSPRPSLFNIDAFRDPEGIGVFVEGEDDVMALHEVGYVQVTTLANGAPKRLSKTYDPANDTDERYAALVGEERIAKLSRIYLAGDTDAAGMNHREEIARRVGKWRCWNVLWPEGCKDAKETLQKRGREAVCEALELATPYPLDGVDRFTDQEVLDVRAGRIGKRYVTGFRPIDERISLSAAGQLIVCTGVPGHGKSLLCNMLGVMYAERWYTEVKDDPTLPPFHTVIFSGETPTRRLVIDLAAMHAQKPAFPDDIVPHLSDDEMVEQLAWVRKHFSFIAWDDAASEVPISWLMARARDLIRANKARLFIIDPMQEVDEEMPDTERNSSKWTGKILGRLRAMAYELGVNIVVVVHPMKRRRVEGKFLMPLGDDIADSRFYATKCHIGITVHRADLTNNRVLLHTWKAKDMQYAKAGDTELEVQPLTKRLWPRPELVDALTVPPPSRFWQEDAG